MLIKVFNYFTKYFSIYRELLQKLKQLQEQHDNVQKKSARLTLHNEELQWRLKQNAERYSITINELSKSYGSTSFDDRAGSSFMESTSTLENDHNGSSPPASPIIKGVVEKSDSVSWVLEMDDETPNEVLRMVRRAGSFRSEKCSPSPVPKRQKCQNSNSIQQSASATSIMRQQSSEMTPSKSLSSNGRSRSKSVSASKAIEHAQPRAIPQIVRSMSGNGAVKNLSENGWKLNSGCLNTMKTSSPNPKKVSIESMGDELIIDEDFNTTADKHDFFLNDEAADLNEPVVFHSRDTSPKFKKTRENRGLITCDTAALTTSTEIVKKHRKPKTSGGEAMISGSNSEDEEQSTGSSAVSTGPSTPSISSSTTSSSDQQPIESIEDALLRWKEQNHPMEVSWCEEGEPSESCV